MQETIYHIPALLPECLEGLQIAPEGTYVDVTFGGGGHSKAILQALGDEGHLYAFDQDLDAIENAPEDDRFTFIRSNFCFLKNFLRYHNVTEIDGLMADLGVSFHHFDDETRGFSFRFDSQLDMRMNQASPLTAEVVVNDYPEEQLANLLYLYGEMKSSRRIAAAIVRARGENRITHTSQLLQIVSPFIAKKQEKKELAQLFQALRIEVNNEMETLEKLLQQATEVTRSGGRIVVLTYHSLEDRLVKNFFKTGNVKGELKKDFFGRVESPLTLVNNRVIVPSDEEIERNPRSRSAKLRIAQKR